MNNKLTFEDGYNQALKDYESNKNLEELWLNHCYSLKGFWFNNPKKPPSYDLWGNKIKTNDYITIVTRFDKGYEKALQDLEKKEQQEHPLQKKIDDYLEEENGK